MDPATICTAISRLIELAAKVGGGKVAEPLREIQRYQRELEKVISEERKTYTETINSQRARHAQVASKAQADKAKLKKQVRTLKAKVVELEAKIKAQKLKPSPLEVRRKAAADALASYSGRLS